MLPIDATPVPIETFQSLIFTKRRETRTQFAIKTLISELLDHIPLI